jgi:hypothetical protein
MGPIDISKSEASSCYIASSCRINGHSCEGFAPDRFALEHIAKYRIPFICHR